VLAEGGHAHLRAGHASPIVIGLFRPGNSPAAARRYARRATCRAGSRLAPATAPPALTLARTPPGRVFLHKHHMQVRNARGSVRPWRVHGMKGLQEVPMGKARLGVARDVALGRLKRARDEVQQRALTNACGAACAFGAAPCARGCRRPAESIGKLRGRVRMSATGRTSLSETGAVVGAQARSTAHAAPGGAGPGAGACRSGPRSRSGSPCPGQSSGLRTASGRPGSRS